MTDAEAHWHSLLQDPPAGAHVILWCDESPSCDAAMETFLRGGLARDDLCVVMVPAPDLAALADRLRARGFDLSRLGEDGRILSTTPENLGLLQPSDAERIPTIAEDLRRLARSCERSGLTVLGRVAPPFFERGQREAAEALERAVRNHAADVRMLCPYRAQSVNPQRIGDAVTVIRCHTHAITPIGGDRFAGETVRPSVDA